MDLKLTISDDQIDALAAAIAEKAAAGLQAVLPDSSPPASAAGKLFDDDDPNYHYEKQADFVVDADRGDDANDGVTAPWKTFQHAMSKDLPAGAVVDLCGDFGQELRPKAEGGASINVQGSGITWRRARGKRFIISGAHLGSDDLAWRFANSKGAKIFGLEMHDMPRTGLFWQFCQECELYDYYAHDNAGTGWMMYTGNQNNLVHKFVCIRNGFKPWMAMTDQDAAGISWDRGVDHPVNSMNRVQRGLLAYSPDDNMDNFGGDGSQFEALVALWAGCAPDRRTLWDLTSGKDQDGQGFKLNGPPASNHGLTDWNNQLPDGDYTPDFLEHDVTATRCIGALNQLYNAGSNGSTGNRGKITFRLSRFSSYRAGPTTKPLPWGGNGFAFAYGVPVELARSFDFASQRDSANQFTGDKQSAPGSILGGLSLADFVSLDPDNAWFLSPKAGGKLDVAAGAIGALDVGQRICDLLGFDHLPYIKPTSDYVLGKVP